MWIFDHQTLQFLEVNPAAVVRYGYSRSEFLKMKITEIRPKDQIPKLLAGIRPFRHLGSLITGRQHLTKGRKLIDVEITASQFYFQGRPAVLVEAQDITERKQEKHVVIQELSEIILQLERARGLVDSDRMSTAQYINDALLLAKRSLAEARRLIAEEETTKFSFPVQRPQLTDREKEVLHLIATGKTNKEIAVQLEITEGTVKIHVHHILRKLRTTARTEAAIVALKTGIVRI